jgi:hypothetical protein
MDTPVSKQGWGERRCKDRVTLQIILAFIITCPITFTQDRVSVFDKYLHWPCVSVKVIYIHCNKISVNIKNLDLYKC